MTTESLRSQAFDDEFLWGVATASYQVEGAVDADGRTPSIWDTFCRTPGKVLHGHTGDIAADQYHRYAEDIDLMADLGVGAYRFSIAWPRVFPQAGRLNRAGFDYYHRLIDGLLARGIAPAVTLYHWDLPQYLQDAGGWPNRDTAYRFQDFAAAVFEELSAKVDFWITLNEPWCAAVLGYLHGHHAPGLRDSTAAYRAIHHLNLAHGLAVQTFRQAGYPGRIGITHNLSLPRPAGRRREDALAADRAADQLSRMFVDPLMGRGYPQRHLDALGVSMPVGPGDLDLVAQKIDFMGINYYTESVVKFAADAPEQGVTVPQHEPVTAMGWPVVPHGLYRLLRWTAEQTDNLPLYITENGAAFADRLTDDGRRCHDPQRVDYLRAHFAECAAAIADGVNLQGYFLWSFIDNFEWAFGYERRFGIVYCDYVNCRRVPKDSYYYYRDVITGTAT